MISCQNKFFVTTNTAGDCCEVSLKTSSGVTLVNVKTAWSFVQDTQWLSTYVETQS